jgi:hypothetical protein
MPDIILDELDPALQNGQAPEAIHPGQIGFEGAWGENSALKRAHNVLASASNKVTAIEEMRLNRVSDMVEHCEKVKRAVDTFGREWADQFQPAKDELKRERSRVEDSLKAKAGLKVNPDYRSAIVGVFSGLSAAAKAAEIDRALAEGDGPTLAVLLEAPPLVTGLSKEQREAIAVRAYSNADPASYALLQQLEKSIARAERASLAAMDTIIKLNTGTNRFDKKRERARAAQERLAG